MCPGAAAPYPTHQEKPVYDLAGNPMANPFDRSQFAPAGINLGPSIQNPTQYYRSNYGTASWYGLEVMGRRQDMWGNDRQKGEYDPCPQGWRVISGDLIQALPIVPITSVPQDIAYFGVDYGMDNGYQVGFFPFVICLDNGNLWHTTNYLMYKYANPGEYTGGRGLRYGLTPSNNIGPSSTYGSAVRCQKYE
jgi:hypothetical protein